MRAPRRGRSLIALALTLTALAAAAWAAGHWLWGPARLHEAFTPLAGVAVFAWLVLAVLAIIRLMLLRAGRSRSAHSLVHLQSLAAIIIVLMAAGATLGGFQAAIVSLGLVGFGLTLALQRPILALAGWATLVFGGAVREGDRIEIGAVRGDVLNIRLFTTRIWEVGGIDSPTPGRPTGRIRTVSNAAFLEGAVANSTTDTATVFDEFVVNVAFESDQAVARATLLEVGSSVLDATIHERMATEYRRLTRGLSIEAEFPNEPFILTESKPSWMEYRLRYLVDARRAARIQSALSEAWAKAIAAKPEAILPIYPRVQQMAVRGDGTPLNP